MLDLSKPRRQSKISILLYVFKNIKGLIALALYTTFGSNYIDNYWAILGLLTAASIIIFISPILKYYYFTFHVENDELIIQKGLLNKERKAIPLERIQSVNITQNLVQRILQLVAVEVETAGSKAKELEIPGLDRAFAVSFKNLLQDKNSSATAITVDEFDDANDAAIQPELLKQSEFANENYDLVSLEIIDLLKIGITQNHLRSGGLALGVVFGFWYNIKDLVERFYGDIFEGFAWENMLAYANLTLFLGAFLVFVIASVIVSVVLSINKYYGYKLKRNGNYLEIEMGLLNRREIKIPIQKIQILEFHTNPLRRLLNYHTAKIYQAQAQGSSITGAEVPACNPDLMAILQDLIFEHKIQEPQAQLQSIALSHARLTSYLLLTPALIAIVATVYLELYLISGIVLAVFAALIFKSYQDGKRTSIVADEQLITMKSGWLFPSIRTIPIYKMQAVEKWRSIFLKRRKQIHFILHTAAGSRGLRYFMQNEVD